jgi:hypothetical protein
MAEMMMMMGKMQWRDAREWMKSWKIYSWNPAACVVRSIYCVVLWLAENKVHASLVQASMSTATATALPRPIADNKEVGVKAAAKADISDLSDLVIRCFSTMISTVMTGPWLPL